MLTGNKGEWSEIYVLLKILADQKIYAADENLQKIEEIFFPVLKIIREESKEHLVEYNTGENIEIYVNDKQIRFLPNSIFETESQFLLEKLKSNKTKGTFAIERTQKFMENIGCFKLSAPSTNKSDITIKMLDINTGYSPTVGFSVKSELGAAPTLLNAGKTTNFIYLIESSEDIISETNSIYLTTGNKQHIDVRKRVSHITNLGSKMKYYGMNNKIFEDNLVLIDSCMDRIIAETILYFYRDNISRCVDLVQKLERDNPMGYGNVSSYSYKFKKFLTAIALGMRPATKWDGVDEASGGYIIVTRSGDVLAYHIYNRNYFEEYLLRNTKYETASTKRYGFGEVYEEDGKQFINLNLQIRFL